MNIAFIDMVFIVVILACVLISVIKGFVASFFGKASFIVGILLGVFFAQKLDVFVANYINVPYLTTIISFLIIFVFSFLVMKLIQVLIKSLFSGEIMGSLDKALGFFWGLAEGLLIVGVICVILIVQPFFDLSELLSKSFFASKIFPAFVNTESLKGAVNITFDFVNKLGNFNVWEFTLSKYI